MGSDVKVVREGDVFVWIRDDGETNKVRLSDLFQYIGILQSGIDEAHSAVCVIERLLQDKFKREATIGYMESKGLAVLCGGIAERLMRYDYELVDSFSCLQVIENYKF